MSPVTTRGPGWSAPRLQSNTYARHSDGSLEARTWKLPSGRAVTGWRVYDDADREALGVLWEASDRSCGARRRCRGRSRWPALSAVGGGRAPTRKMLKEGEILCCALDGTGVPALPSETAGRVGKNGGRARTREAKVGALWVVAPDGELVGIR